ncbi:MAG: MraY family glycosyltransferase [bacterium]
MLKLAANNFLIPLGVVYLSVFLLRKLALKFNIVDTPNRRKIHKTPIPILGGLAIFLGMGAAIYLNPEVIKEFSFLFAGATFILIVNLMDDIKGLSAVFRFTIEFIIALFVILTGTRISFLPPGMLGDSIEVIISLIWLVGIANAFNYLDGMDGLAAGSAAINALFFAFILFRTQQPQLGFLALIVMASCLGFLPHNFNKKAKMFLGDSGSTFIGFMLASIAMRGNWAEDNIIKLTVPILILGVPIFDMILTTIMRIREEKISTIIEWFKYGGKDHFHHRLVDLGLRTTGAVLAIYFITIALGINAIIIANSRGRLEGFLAIIQASIIFGVIAVLMLIGKKRRSGWNIAQKNKPLC